MYWRGHSVLNWRLEVLDGERQSEKGWGDLGHHKVDFRASLSKSLIAIALSPCVPDFPVQVPGSGTWVI